MVPNLVRRCVGSAGASSPSSNPELSDRTRADDHTGFAGSGLPDCRRERPPTSRPRANERGSKAASPSKRPKVPSSRSPPVSRRSLAPASASKTVPSCPPSQSATPIRIAARQLRSASGTAISTRPIGSCSPAPDAATLVPVAKIIWPPICARKVPGGAKTLDVLEFGFVGRKDRYFVFQAADPNGAVTFNIIDA